MKNLFLCLITIGLLCGCANGTDGEPDAEASVNVDTDGMKEAFNDAEREIEKGAAKAKDKLEDAGDAISDKFEEAKDELSDDNKAEVKVEIEKD